MSTPTPLSRPHAPETWLVARRLAGIVLGPLDRFLKIEAASGIVLLVAAAVALVWANSRFGASYEHLLHTPVRLGIGSLSIEQPLHFVINDVLMTIFFFVVGLEIRREIHEGELADRQRAMLPAVAAVGGMLAPAAIYYAVSTPETRSGFGVPTATDIAFAVGVLALLGKRVPPALRVLLLTLAIIDDIGAILVIESSIQRGSRGPGSSSRRPGSPGSSCCRGSVSGSRSIMWRPERCCGWVSIGPAFTPRSRA